MLGLLITAGQRGDSPQLPAVLARIRVPRRGPGRPRTRPEHLSADKAYSSRANRRLLRRRKIRHTIPEPRDQRANRRNRGSAGGRPTSFDTERYKQRNVVERAINRLKNFRAAATRYDKKCECAETKTGRRLNLRKSDDRKAAERVWAKCAHSWTVRYRLGGRTSKQQEQSYPHEMKRDAEAFILEIKSDKVSGLRRTIDPKAGAITFESFAEKWLAGRVSLAPKSIEVYRSCLKNLINPTIGHMRLNAVTRQTIKNLISALSKGGYAPNSVNGAYRVIAEILSEAAKDKLIPESPCVDIELPNPAQHQDFYVPSWGQIKSLADSMPAQWRATVWLMAGCGLRVSEAFAVGTGCEMFGGKRLRIHEQITRKRVPGPLKHREEGDYRDMPLPPFVAEAIATHIDDHGTTDGYLFTGRVEGFVKYESYRTAFVAAVKKAGLPEDFTPHGLRHAYASMQLAQGIPITDVSRWLGHQDMGITFRTYGHLVDEAWDTAVSLMQTAYQTGISTNVAAAAC